MTKKNKYLKRLWDNLPLVMPHTFAIIMGMFILVVFMKMSLGFIDSIDNDNGKILALLVLMMCFMKLISFIGYDLFNNWANRLIDAMSHDK